MASVVSLSSLTHISFLEALFSFLIFAQFLEIHHYFRLVVTVGL